MTIQQPLRMDPDAFLAWEIRQERRYELVGGVVKLMAGATRAHQMICLNTALALKSRLRGGPCMALTEQKIKIPNRNFRYADVSVDCGPHGMRDLTATQPTVAFEVESPSTSVLDELARLEDYQAAPSIAHIVILAQDRPRAKVFSRTDAGWVSVDAEGLDAALALPALDLTLPLAELYDGVTFEPAPAAEA